MVAKTHFTGGRAASAAVALMLGLAASSCSEASATGPTAIGNNATMTVETFSGTLPLTGFRFFSFAVPHAGATTLILLSLTENGAPSTATVQIGLGVPRGTDCALTDAAMVNPNVTGQVASLYQPSIYCARIGDTGNLKAPANFSINIIHPR
jgi:hypothetical protein